MTGQGVRGSVRVERMGDRVAAALAYLARAPQENVFVSYLLLFDTSAAARHALFVALDEAHQICGVAYFGRQIVLACDEAALDAMAQVGRSFHGERMIVGAYDTVRGYWERIRSWHVPPRLVRERQFVMALDRTQLQPYQRKTIARRARIDEWTAVADSSANMISQELEYDPRRLSPEFATNVRSMIERGLWWVGEELGRLCFFCNVGPWSTHTIQLQGIWTPPEMRRHGLATASLSAICEHLLETSPSLSLYVNDFNEPAIQLYERIGFKTVSAFQTILF